MKSTPRQVSATLWHYKAAHNTPDLLEHVAHFLEVTNPDTGNVDTVLGCIDCGKTYGSSGVLPHEPRRIPLFNESGEPILNADGTQKIKEVW